MRFLKLALICLYAAKEIACEMLNEKQWIVLEQIEITLKIFNVAENLGRGGVPNWIIGLFPQSAIYAICMHYVTVLNSSYAQEPVKSLTKILLEDFDKH